MLVVFLHPAGHRPLLRAQINGRILLRLRGVDAGAFRHLPAVHWVEQDCPLQQLAQLPRRGVQYGRLPLCLLELLAGLQQNLGAVSLLSCLPGLAFDAQGQRTGHQAGYQHDGEGQWIARVVGQQGKARHRKEEVVDQNADQRSRSPIAPAPRPHRSEQHPQDVDRNNVGLTEAQQVKKPSHHRGQSQAQRRFSRIRPREMGMPTPRLLPGAVGRLVVRDDIDIQIRRALRQPVHQTPAPGTQRALSVAAAQHDLGDPGGTGIFGNLDGRIVAIGGSNTGSQLLRQTQVGPEPPPILGVLGLKIRRLHEKGRKLTVEGLRHSGRGADHLGVGGRSRQAGKHMLVPHTGTARCFGGPAQSVGRAAQGDLPQGRQVFLGKEVVLGPAGLSRPVDFPRP